MNEALFLSPAIFYWPPLLTYGVLCQNAKRNRRHLPLDGRLYCSNVIYTEHMSIFATSFSLYCIVFYLLNALNRSD